MLCGSLIPVRTPSGNHENPGNNGRDAWDSACQLEQSAVQANLAITGRGSKTDMLGRGARRYGGPNLGGDAQVVETWRESNVGW